jgi:hypothetical protein
MKTTEFTPTLNATLAKKVLLYSSDFESGRTVLQQIKETNEHFVESVEDSNELVEEIARTTPHLLIVILPAEPAWLLNVLAGIDDLFPDLPVCLVAGDLSQEDNPWRQDLAESLSQPIKPEVPRPYAEDSRIVLHDESLRALWRGKLNRPQQVEGWEKTCAHQEARFVLQLQTARKNHDAAKNYFECLRTQQAGLNQEIAYRLPHGSYKALSWARELAAKWLALLAHYIPDAELQFLPRAGTPGPAVDYVHHDVPIDSVYAATLMLCSTVKASVGEAIKELVTTKFDRHDDNALFATSLKLYGMAKFLEQVGTAQIELMDAWLDPSIVNRAGDREVPRGEHRNAGIYRDFYDLPYIVVSPEPLDSILKGFHAGTTYVKERPFLPSFAEFRRISRQNPTGK